MTEDATNTEEWGPTTKTMAAISNASKNFDDYERVVQVLRGRYISLHLFSDFFQLEYSSITPMQIKNAYHLEI